MRYDKYIDNIITSRRSARIFIKRRLSEKIVRQILATAIWAPCPHGFQPWKFVILRRKSTKKVEIIRMLENNADSVSVGLRAIFKHNIEIMKKADMMIAVFNMHDLMFKAKSFEASYGRVFEIFEIQSISAVIQNILLGSSARKIGSLWIGLPIIFGKRISRILGEDNAELMAFVVLGYTKNHLKITTRIPLQKKMRFR